jgi:hypothetical protein
LVPDSSDDKGTLVDSGILNLKMGGWDTLMKGRRNLPSQSDTGTSSRGFVHLTKHQGDLGFTIELDDGSFLHFVVQIVTLTSSFADTGEDGVTTVSLGNVVLSR